MVLTIPMQTDIVVQAADGSLLAFVEVKNLEELSPEIAAVLRRNLIAHGGGNWRPTFFLIMSQDVGYLWDERALPPEDAPPPTIDFPTASLVEFYLPSFVGRGRLSGSQLELAVSQWLWDLANGVENRPKEPEIALAGTDFPRLIDGAKISF